MKRGKERFSQQQKMCSLPASLFFPPPPLIHLFRTMGECLLCKSPEDPVFAEKLFFNSFHDLPCSYKEIFITCFDFHGGNSLLFSNAILHPATSLPSTPHALTDLYNSSFMQPEEGICNIYLHIRKPLVPGHLISTDNTTH